MNSSHRSHLDRHCLTPCIARAHRHWFKRSTSFLGMRNGCWSRCQHSAHSCCILHEAQLMLRQTLAYTSGLRSKNTDMAYRYFFCGPERCRILYMYIIYVQIPECDTFRNRTRDGAHCAPPRIRSVTGCVHPPAHGVRTRLAVPPKQGFSQKPQKPRFWGPDRVSKQ